MSKRKVTIRAFTIMEVTISMLVAAIVVAMTYSAYGIIIRSWLEFTDNNQKMAVVLRLDGLLSRDFEKASFVEKEQSGILVQIGEQPILYRMEPSQVLRISSITDTFKVSQSDIKEYFEGKDLNGVAENDGWDSPLGIENNTGSHGNRLVDEISFSVNLQNTTLLFHYKKKYSAESLMTVKP